MTRKVTLILLYLYALEKSKIRNSPGHMRINFLKKIAIPSNISTYLSRTLILITVAATCLVGGVLIFQQTIYFNKISKQKSQEYINDQKIYIQEIVKNEIRFIKIQDEAFEKRVKEKIYRNVNQAYHTAKMIYEKYGDKKSEEEIKALIIATVASLKLDLSYERIFISNLDGTGVYYPTRSQFSGKDITGFTDSSGEPVVLREIQLLKSREEGFLEYNGDYRGQTTGMNKKIVYVKKFGHFNWYFGSKQYMADYFPEFKEEISQKISSLRFRNGGYVFLNNMDGTPLVMDGEVYKGPINMLADTLNPKHKIFSRELELIKNSPAGGYFNYEWNKIGETTSTEKCSYIETYPKYNWIVGAGFYMDEIQRSIVDQQNALHKDQQKSIMIILSIFVLLLILEVIIIYNFNKQYKSDFERFFNFFYWSNESFNKLDVAEFYFEEFKHAAVEANNMVDHRKMIEAKLIEEQKRATESDRLKSAFLANMSHEIRTPMNAIVGFSELLEDESQNPEDKTLFIRLIKKNGEILLNLINDIIDISKIEANLLSVKKRKIELNQFLNDIEHHFSEIIASQKEKTIDFQIERQLPGNFQIITDEIRLRQILNNLIGNAVKFTAKGAIRVTVKSDDDSVNFCVSDTGIGIPAQQQQKIFERFMQADQGKVNFGGNGLGLAISKNLIELLGGSISVESEPGKGSKFYFHIRIN